MQNMEIEYKRRSNSFSARSSSLLCPISLLVIVLSIVILVLSSILVHKSFSTEPEKQLSLREKYPGYFRYPEEQDAFEKLERKVENVTSFTGISGSNDSARCTLGSPFYPIRPSDRIDNNACCKSEGKYISPEYWVDVVGINRTMAVFTSVSGTEARQHFYTENCEEIVGCTYQCRCGQRDYYVTGVYVTGSDEYNVGWFSLPGCCKCRNF